VGDYCSIMPPEVAEEYGDFSDWKNSVGTGPFMLTDYVSMSSAIFVRNPDYWRKHPLYPEDTMPYLDGVKWLIIPDRSTRISALRTGKVDRLGLGWEDAGDVAKTNPELLMASSPPTMSSLLFMRTDKPESPFYDRRVRQALQLGLDNQAIINDYYEGNAVLINHPLAPMLEFKDMYTPLEELPGTVQELYGYKNEKAKQLLAEAGYPDGFETSVICTEAYVDLLSIVKAYWEEIGVILNIEPKETAVYSSIGFRRTHKDMYMGQGIDTTPSSWVNFSPDNTGNRSLIDDPRVNQAIEDWLKNSSDWDKLCQIAKDIYPYILEQAWTVPLPAAYSYVAWQPWLKDYHGENAVGYYNWQNYPLYVWIDQDLKEEMTGGR
jgi:peptide/nickel transport system substrate-binding protein